MTIYVVRICDDETYNTKRYIPVHAIKEITFENGNDFIKTEDGWHTCYDGKLVVTDIESEKNLENTVPKYFPDCKY